MAQYLKDFMWSLGAMPKCSLDADPDTSKRHISSFDPVGNVTNSPLFPSFQDIIEVDGETKEMLKMMDFQSIPGLQLTTSRGGGGGGGGNYRN